MLVCLRDILSKPLQQPDRSFRLVKSALQGVAMNVLFICSANMCRSPMAEGYLRATASERGLDDIRVRSAAVFHSPGYTATEGARWTAVANGFDLESHRSTTLDDELFDWADAILVMTHSHGREILSAFGKEAAEKTFLLGQFDPDFRSDVERSAEIDDPYGSSHATYETVFGRIRRSIDAWLEEKS